MQKYTNFQKTINKELKPGLNVGIYNGNNSRVLLILNAANSINIVQSIDINNIYITEIINYF